MPVPEDRLYKAEGLNRWFAISSVLMTASLLWMIAIDHYRPWREYQNSYYVSKAALAHLEYLDANREDKLQEIRTAEAGLESARELAANPIAAKKDASLSEELVQVGLKFKLADGEWSREKQLTDVTKDSYEKVLNEYGQEHPKTKALHKKLRAEEEEVEALQRAKEGYEEQKAGLEAQLAELQKPVRKAEKVLVELRQAAVDALEKDQQFRGVLTDTGLLAGLPIISTLINAPILDFAAPKTTTGRNQIKQLVLPDIRQRLNYLETYTTDRCTTCHIAIDDPQFAMVNLAKQLERSLPAINEELQRRGLDPMDPPTPPALAKNDGTLPVGRVTEHWEELDKTQQEAYFEVLLAQVNSYLKASNRKTIDLGQPLLAHPDLDLFLSVDSPHPISKMGCTVCHEGNPQETDFVQAAHSPPTHEARKRWKEEHYVTHLGVPTVTFETIEHYWDRPMHLPNHTEAGCAKCHSQVSDIASFDGKRQGVRINLGRHLFKSVGCVNCHQVDALADARRVGPDLAHVAGKLKPEFLQQWVFFPQKFRPSTRMPHFFQQENNREESATSLDPHPVLRTQTEVAAISKYLFAVSKPWTPLAPPDDVQGDVARGRELFKTVGCLGCHGNITEFGQEQITAHMQHEEGIDAETAKYRYLGMTYDQRVRYAMENFTLEVDTFLDPDTARFNPDQDYNTPTFSRFAPDLSGIGSKVTAEWLYSWVTEPTHYAANTIMPSMRLTPPEASDLAAYLMTLRNDVFDQAEFATDGESADMVDGLMFELLSAQRSERHSLRIIADEGGELTEMVVHLLKSGRDEKNPESGMDEKTARALVEPMSAGDRKLMFLGNKMIAHYGCYTCHDISGFATTTPVGTDLSIWAEKPVSQLDFAFYDHAFHHQREAKEDVFGYVYPLDADALNYQSPIDDRAREEIAQTHTGFAQHKMLNPRIWDREKLKKPYDKLKMPNFYFTEKEAEALTTYLLSRIPARVNDVLKIDYASGTLGPIAAGRDLTRELNCNGCHQIEDNAPTIQQYFRREVGGRLQFDETNAPPGLWGEGAKVQHNWFHRFLQQVEPLRPWLQVRMPSFNLTGDQATTLVQYFAALSQRDAEMLAELRLPIDEYKAEEAKSAARRGDKADADAPGADWYRQDSLERRASQLRRWSIGRKLMRSAELDPLRTSPDRFKKAHATLLDKTQYMQKLYDVAYPFVEPPQPLSPRAEFERNQSFFNDMGCLACHVLGGMLPGPAKNTDDFVQMYRLDGVRGQGDQAVAILNGEPYAIGSVIDGHTLISAENVYNDDGDLSTSAVISGLNAAGDAEQVALQAASAPNLALTYQRLRRTWVYEWMLQPGWIEPGTNMPQNFPGGESPFAGSAEYPGTGSDHINMLVDYLFQAGATNTRAPLVKAVLTEDEGFEDDEEGFGDDEFDD